jgi:predicted ester cyclase
MYSNKEIDDIVKKTLEDNKMNKIGDNIYLSNKQIRILDKYKINYKKYTDIKSLIFEIEQIISESYDVNDLEELSIELSEFNYYYNTNK